jgi:hypothetical protein
VNAADNQHEKGRSCWLVPIEIGLIFLLFFLYAGWQPPDVNEAHYLAKAVHYWQPDWCAGDHFLESADAHLIFYWTFGWLTLLLPLPACAWIGRFITWGLLAWSWRRLSWAVIARPFVSLLTVSLFLLFGGRFHMAGEWVIGGVEAKGFAYVLVFFALERLLSGRWSAAWILLGLATSFHVLVGGWSLIAAACAWLSCGGLRPTVKSMLPGMLLGALLALPGLVPALLLNTGAEADVVRLSNYIYVFHRLPHHLVFHRFEHLYIARHALLLIVWLAVCLATPCRLSSGVLGQRPLRGFVAGAVALALVGIIIDQSAVALAVVSSRFDQSSLHYLEAAATWLKYYWYRLSDSILPIGAAIAISAWIFRLQQKRPRFSQVVLICAIVIAGANLSMTNYRRRSDLRPAAVEQMTKEMDLTTDEALRKFADWQQACAWIAANTPPDARFITPRTQQTFKWYAGRSEVCSWKDVPQNAESVVQWWRRQQEIYPRRVIRGGLVAHGEQRLEELADTYDAQYIMIDRDTSPRPLLLPRVYPANFDMACPTYEIYRVPRADR